MVILRSGITMLQPFLEYFPQATVGVIGMRRDEQTAEPHLYYENIPPLQQDQLVLLLDPMLATGGTTVATLKILTERGIKEENVVFVGIVSAPEGVQNLKVNFPQVKTLIAAEDERLNSDFFIVPGLGDFGDRYFGTE